MSRKCKNWLESLAWYVEETESPRKFWMWSGIFTLCCALQRRVWLPFGIAGNLYPNLFVMVVAPPGRCRKGAPVGFAKKILEDAQLHVFVDSPTKRALTKQLDELSRTETFYIDSRPRPQSPLALISKELSSFMAVDPKSMIEILTDLFDSHDTWKYKTSEKGADSIAGVCISCLFATTPSWMASNLPEEAIGGGFTSRFVLVSATEKYRFISLPPQPDTQLYNDLLSDLVHIAATLSGEFQWGPGAYDHYDEWYNGIEATVKNTHDERLHGFLERIHVVMFKVAMALRVAHSDELILTVDEVSKAIALVEAALRDAPSALSSQGRSFAAVDIDRVSRQIKTTPEGIVFGKLLQWNYHNVSKQQLYEVLENLVAMGSITWNFDGKTPIKWRGKKYVD